MARKFPTWIVVLAGLLACAGLGLCLTGVVLFARQSLGPGAASAPAVGDKADDFTLTSTQGGSISLSGFHGKPVLLHFFTTWCGPCREEMPMIQRKFEQMQPRLVVVAVEEGDSRREVEAYVEEMGLTFTVLLDPLTLTGNEFGINFYPTSIFIDADGIIRSIQIGTMEPATLDDSLSLIGIQ